MRSRVRIRTHGSVGRRRLWPPLTRSKMSVSLAAQGLAKVDHIRWDAFNESNDLEAQVEAYHRR